MPPPALLVSMDMGSLTSLIHPFDRLAADFHLHSLMLQIQLHSSHFPGRFHPQQSLIEILLIHLPTYQAPLAYPTLFPEEAAVIMSLGFLSAIGCCNETISVEARPNSAGIFLNPGTITVDYVLPVMFAGSGIDGGAPGGGGSGLLADHGLQILVTAGDQTLANYQIENPSIVQDTTVLNEGTFSFYNPIAQVLSILAEGPTYVVFAGGVFISSFSNGASKMGKRCFSVSRVPAVVQWLHRRLQPMGEIRLQSAALTSMP